MRRRTTGRALSVLIALTALIGISASTVASGAAPNNKNFLASSSANKPLKVALLLDGVAKDGGWDQVAVNDFAQVKAKFGSKIETTIEQSVPFSSAAGQIVDRLIGQGYTVFFATSGGYEDYLAPVAKAHPNIQIEQVQGPYTSRNYGLYQADYVEASYLGGMMMAGASKTTPDIGFIGAFAFPAYLNGINAVELGAKAVNPGATEHYIYVSSFYDPTKEASATQALIAAGATAVVGMTDDPSVCETAASKGIPCMNEDLLQSYGSKTYLGSVMFYNAWAFEEVINDELGHVPVPRALYGNGTIRANGVTFGPAYSLLVSAKVRGQISSTVKAMANGTFHDYAGPVRDTTGKLRVAAGKYLTTAQWIAMSWYVQGVKA
jgi:simple sugar transport system substrate-binding protein